jgi:hypothetical protein
LRLFFAPFAVKALDLAQSAKDHEPQRTQRKPQRTQSKLWLSKHPGVKLHNFAHVRQKIGQAMVTGVGMIFVLYAFRLQLTVQGGGAVFEPEVILLAAIKVDGKISQR